MSYWTGFLGPDRVTEPNNALTIMVYDAYARPTTVTSPAGAQTTLTYTNSPPTKTATTNGRWVKTTYDGLGRTIKTESGYSTTTVSIADTEYDSCACSPLGKVKRVSQPYAPGGTIYWTLTRTTAWAGLSAFRCPTTAAQTRICTRATRSKSKVDPIVKTIFRRQ